MPESQLLVVVFGPNDEFEGRLRNSLNQSAAQKQEALEQVSDLNDAGGYANILLCSLSADAVLDSTESVEELLVDFLRAVGITARRPAGENADVSFSWLATTIAGDYDGEATFGDAESTFAMPGASGGISLGR